MMGHACLDLCILLLELADLLVSLTILIWQIFQISIKCFFLNLEIFGFGEDFLLQILGLLLFSLDLIDQASQLHVFA